ncbi:hypothetical protein VTK26DRAFT_2937 [Humicola hyalothermophila]
MHQHHTQILGIPSLKDLHQELDHMKVHILDPKPGQVKNETGLLVRMANHGPDGLDVMQDKHLHRLGRLQLGVVQADLDDKDGTALAVGPADVGLARAVLGHEPPLVVGQLVGGQQADAVAPAHDVVLEPPLVAPVERRHQHVHGAVDVPLARAQEPQHHDVRVVRQHEAPQPLPEAVGRGVAREQLLAELGGPVGRRVVDALLDAAEPEEVDPCRLQLNLFFGRQVAEVAGESGRDFDFGHGDRRRRLVERVRIGRCLLIIEVYARRVRISSAPRNKCCRTWH